MSNKKTCVLVFSGFNPRAVVSFLRTMKVKKVDYVIVAKSKQDDIFLTEYRDKVLSVRESEALVLDDLLNNIEKVKKIKGVEELIIAPTTEALNRFMLENRNSFEKLGCIIPLVEKKIYELISDKYSFGELCFKNEILLPKEIDLCKEIKFPIVAKPRKYLSNINNEALYPIIIENYLMYEVFIKNYRVEDFYYQEYIKGRSLYLLYYFHREGQVYKFSQENLVQQPDGKSILAAISSDFHDSEESRKYENMFKKLNYHGFVMIEIKQRGNKNYMIEANPRFWGPSQLFVDAGMNLFEAFLHDYGLIDSSIIFKMKKTKARYFWFGGLINVIKNSNKPVFYNISENEFLTSLPEWLLNDIYRRNDTIDIFRKEVSNG